MAGQKWLGLAWKIARQDSFRSAQKKSRKFSLSVFLMVVFLSAQVPLTDLRVSHNTGRIVELLHSEFEFFKKASEEVLECQNKKKYRTRTSQRDNVNHVFRFHSFLGVYFV